MTTCACDTFTSATTATALTAYNSGTGASAGKGAVIYSTGEAEAILCTAQTVSHYCLTATNFGSSGGGVSGDARGAGIGVYGISISGSGVSGTSSSGYGTTGWSAGSNMGGVYGVNTHASSGYGVYGLGTGTVSTGVFGNGPYRGVYGQSAEGYGVYGFASGVGISTLSTGVYGEGGYCAIRGRVSAGVPGAIGLYISASNGASGAVIYGNSMVVGSLSKSSGTFTIDHPSDPENKILQHSFVESPDMLNVYNGTVMCNEKGEATVELPAYFEALNTDFKYQLTAIGAPAPNLHISKEVEKGEFSIGGAPGLKVSWNVTGIRKDAYALANPIIVEQEKKDEEKGFYLNPEVFGKTYNESIHCLRHDKNIESDRRASQMGVDQ